MKNSSNIGSLAPAIVRDRTKPAMVATWCHPQNWKHITHWLQRLSRSYRQQVQNVWYICDLFQSTTCRST